MKIKPGQIYRHFHRHDMVVLILDTVYDGGGVFSVSYKLSYVGGDETNRVERIKADIYWFERMVNSRVWLYVGSKETV